MTLNETRKQENITIAIDGGWIDLRASFSGADCFATLYLDMGDAMNANFNSPLYGNIRAKETTLTTVIRDGGFRFLDFDLPDFFLSEYDKFVTLTAGLLWFHRRDFEAEESRLDSIFEAAMLAKLNRTAPDPEIELSDISLPDSNKIKLAGFDKNTAN